jgi:hypothetical protein
MQWSTHYTVIFKEMPDYSLMDVSRIIKFNPFEVHPIYSQATHCDGNIDTINEALLPDSALVVGKLFKVQGWLAKSIRPKAELAPSVFLVLTDKKGTHRFIKTSQMLRPDVGAYFKKSKLNPSGFVATASVSGLNGNYILGLAYKEKRGLKLCPQFKIPVTFKLDKIVDNVKDKKIAMTKQCMGAIDEVNGHSTPTSFTTNKLLKVRGWFAKSIEPEASLPQEVFLVLTNSDGKRIFIKTRQMPRPDVGEYFKKPLLDTSGYVSYADVSKIKGEYTLGLAYLEEDHIQICPEFNIAGQFKNKA